MKKKEYQDKIAQWAEIRRQAEAQMFELTKKWQKQCMHKTEHITMIVNTGEDETGRYVPDWNTYQYECTNCGKKLSADKKFKTPEDLREAMRK